MDGRRFDSLTTAIARRRTRRSAVHGAGAGLAAFLGSVAGFRGAVAQDATPAADPSHPTFLFVQTATGGRFTPNSLVGTPVVEGTPTPGSGAEYLLTLEGHHGGTIYFSDRPDRIFGDTPTQQFLDGLGFSPTNPPNAALVTQGDGEEEVIVLELVAAAYDEASGSLTYGATILGEFAGESLTQVAADQEAGLPPETFGRASLFIDDCVTLVNCIVRTPDFHVYIIGPLPGGPQKLCWDPATDLCSTCTGTMADLEALCNRTYPDCLDLCTPHYLY